MRRFSARKRNSKNARRSNKRRKSLMNRLRKALSFGFGTKKQSDKEYLEHLIGRHHATQMAGKHDTGHSMMVKKGNKWRPKTQREIDEELL